MSESKFSELLVAAAKSAVVWVVGSSIIATVTSIAVFQVLIGSNFETMNHRIDDQYKNFSDKIDSLDRTVSSAVLSMEAATGRIEQLASDIDADVRYMTEFVTDVRNMEEKILLGPALVQARAERLPLGGPGAMPVPGFPTYTYELDFNISDARLNRLKVELTALLEKRLKADRKLEFDPTKHEIEVYENVVVPFGATDARLDITAVVVSREGDSP